MDIDDDIVVDWYLVVVWWTCDQWWSCDLVDLMGLLDRYDGVLEFDLVVGDDDQLIIDDN